jgi:hypothetical protein
LAQRTAQRDLGRALRRGQGRRAGRGSAPRLPGRRRRHRRVLVSQPFAAKSVLRSGRGDPRPPSRVSREPALASPGPGHEFLGTSLEPEPPSARLLAEQLSSPAPGQPAAPHVLERPRCSQRLYYAVPRAALPCRASASGITNESGVPPFRRRACTPPEPEGPANTSGRMSQRPGPESRAPEPPPRYAGAQLSETRFSEARPSKAQLQNDETQRSTITTPRC